LRCNEDYRRCCESSGSGPLTGLYADFGNVCTGDFKSWWQARGQYLFSEPPSMTRVQLVKNPEDLSPDDLQGGLVLVLPLHYNKRELRRRVSSLLKTHHPGKKGGKDFKKSKAKYPLWTKPYVRTLEVTLEVYKLRNAEPDLSLYELGAKLRLNRKYVLNAEGVDLDTTWKRRMMQILVSRYLRHADAYIKNVAKGHFPKK
jgi:hypothetical protein